MDGHHPSGQSPPSRCRCQVGPHRHGGARHRRCDRHRLDHPQALGIAGQPQLPDGCRRLRQGAQQPLGHSGGRHSAVVCRTAGLHRCSGDGAVAAAAGSGGKQERSLPPHLVGNVQRLPGDGGVQRCVAGPDGDQDPGLLLLLRSVRRSLAQSVFAVGDRWWLGRSRAVDFSRHSSGPGGAAGGLDLGLRCRSRPTGSHGHGAWRCSSGDHHQFPGNAGPGGPSHRLWSGDVFGLLVPPLPRAEGVVRQGGHRTAQGGGVRARWPQQPGRPLPQQRS